MSAARIVTECYAIGFSERCAQEKMILARYGISAKVFIAK